MAQDPDAVTRWWRRISLRAKVTGVTVGVLALGLLIAGIGTMPILRTSLIANIDAQLPALVDSDAAGRFFTIEPDGEGGLRFDPRSDPPRAPDYFVAVYGGDGALQAVAGGHRGAEQPNFPANFSLSRAYADAASGHIHTLHSESGAEFHGSVAHGQVQGLLYVQFIALPLEEADEIVATYFGVFTTVALITILIAALLTRGLVTLTFRRLTQVESTAMTIASGDFSQRMTDLEPTTEVGRLNLAINTMLDRIDVSITERERTVRHMRRFIGDASHELRTPLVSVRGYAELYRMGAIQGSEDTARAMERIEKEAIRMGVLVEDLLALARLDEERELEISPIDLRPIARDAALDVRAASPDRVVTVIDHTTDATPHRETPAILHPPAPPARAARSGWLRRRPRAVEETTPVVQNSSVRSAPPVILGEENKVRQVVTNLLGNARRFSPEGSPIEIELNVDRESAVGTIAIVDHGEGIPPQIREQIFQRFWRADTSRARETGGSGLGLAIVSSIVSALDGAVSVDETPGGGATFTVSLPLATVAGTPEHLMAETQPLQKLDL